MRCAILGALGLLTSVSAAQDPPQAEVTLARMPEAALADRFRYASGKPRVGVAAPRVLGAFYLDGRARPRDAWGPGYLPVTVAFEDGRCATLTADQINGVMQNEKITPVACGERPAREAPTARPVDERLRYIGTAWGMSAWADDQAGTTVISTQYGKKFTPFVTARMRVVGLSAISDPHGAGSHITLVGEMDGRSTIAIIDVNHLPR